MIPIFAYTHCCNTLHFPFSSLKTFTGKKEGEKVITQILQTPFPAKLGEECNL